MTKEEVCEELVKYVLAAENECKTINPEDFSKWKNDILSRCSAGDSSVYRLMEGVVDIIWKDIYTKT